MMGEGYMHESQQAVCSRLDMEFFECDPNHKIGISLNVKDRVRPLNGMRIKPESGTCGWYIWAGEVLSGTSDFFAPLHVSHVESWEPLLLPYLGLPPGSRFLITEQYEDVWYDAKLLSI